MYTFAASRPLHALYFDGFSAAKTGNGTLDLQNVLAYGKADDKHLGPDGEYESGQILCEWGKEFGVEGFVREEATFEVTLYLFVFYSSRSKIYLVVFLQLSGRGSASGCRGYDNCLIFSRISAAEISPHLSLASPTAHVASPHNLCFR